MGRRCLTRSILILSMFATAFFMSAATEVNAQEREIRWRWEPGKTLIYRMTQTSDQKMNMQGQEMTTTTNTEMFMREVVESVSEEGIATVSLTYDRMKFEMVSPMMSMEYDSANPPDDDDESPMASMAKSFGSMVGKTITYTVDLSGEVTGVEGMAAIVEEMVGAMGADNPMGRQFAENFKNSMGDESMKSTLNMMMDVLPKDAASRGEQWTTDFEQQIPMMGRMHGEQTHTVADFATVWGHDAVRITSEGTMQLEPMDMEGENAPPVKMNFDNTKLKSEVIFAIDVGYILRTEMTMEMKGDMSFDAGGQEMAMDMDITQKTIMELIEDR